MGASSGLVYGPSCLACCLNRLQSAAHSSFRPSPNSRRAMRIPRHHPPSTNHSFPDCPDISPWNFHGDTAISTPARISRLPLPNETAAWRKRIPVRREGKWRARGPDRTPRGGTVWKSFRDRILVGLLVVRGIDSCVGEVGLGRGTYTVPGREVHGVRKWDELHSPGLE